MKLYTKPGACSTADHIALEWSGLPFDFQALTADEMKSPAYLKINPSGSVPAIVDGDFVLTQNAAILGYIADLAPQAGLMGDGSIKQRAEAQRWLSFVNADLHPAFRPIFHTAAFHPDAEQYEAMRNLARERVQMLYERAEEQLEGKQWLAGFRSAADAYLYVTLRWAERTKIDLSKMPNLRAFRERMETDKGVQAALKSEGLN